MPNNPNPIVKLWNELKRRNVFRVLAMYAGAVFVIIEITNNVVDPLRLPEWIPTVVILILILGFPVTAILSWIFDLTPEGVKKTEPFDSSAEKKVLSGSGRRKLRASDIIIGVLVIAVVVLIYPKIFSKDDFKKVRDSNGKISIAVMPFENLSGDTLYNIWQGGFQNLLINTLSNSEELSVRKYQAVNEVVNSTGDINITSLKTSFTSDIGEKLEARTMILGNILIAGNSIRINAQLIDSETEEIYKTYQVDCDSENDLFRISDSLSSMIKNYIEIKNISEKYNSPEIQGNSITNSSEAFKNYIRGYDAFKYIELESAIDWFNKAIEEDTTFIKAMVINSYANLMFGRNNHAKYWCKLAYEKRADLPTEEKLLLDQLNAYYYETPYEEIKYVKQLIEIDEMNPYYWHTLAFAHYKLFEYEEAVNSWEQIFKLHERWGTDYLNPYTYFLMGDAYHKIDKHDREEEILEMGHRLHPNAILIQQYQAICAFSQGKTEEAERIIEKYKSVRHNVLHCTEAMISSGLGNIYSGANMFDEAENYYRTTIQMEPQNLSWVNDFAWFLIDNDINVNEGLDLLETILEEYPEYWPSLDAKGWGFYKLGKYDEAHKLLTDSWDLRPAYSHNGFLHIQEVEKAIAKQKSVQ